MWKKFKLFLLRLLGERSQDIPIIRQTHRLCEACNGSGVAQIVFAGKSEDKHCAICNDKRKVEGMDNCQWCDGSGKISAVRPNGEKITNACDRCLCGVVPVKCKACSCPQCGGEGHFWGDEVEDTISGIMENDLK